MPTQTTKTEYVYFPDGCKVAIQPNKTGSFIDLGALNSAVNAVLNYDENRVETSNAGNLRTQIKNMIMAGDFTLINLDPEGLEALGAGIMERVVTAASPVTDIADHVIATGFTDKGLIPIEVVGDGASNTGTVYGLSAEPTITSVTGSVDSTLTVDDDYTVVPDANSRSGYSIILNTAGTNLTTTAQTVTIVFTTVTPIASTTLYAGSSTEVLTPYAVRITHTDDDSNIDRQLDLYEVDTASGGFAFSFKGANEDGVDEMPFSIQARIDSSRTTGRQLMGWTVTEPTS